MGLACGGVMIINEMVESPRRDLLARGDDLEFNVSKEQVTEAVARCFVTEAETFAIPTME